MTSELSTFAARLRELIPLWLEDGNDDVEFNGYALLLFALQFKDNATYRKFCEARKVSPDTLTHWKEIPAMPTSAFKEFELTCLSPAERTAVFHSSGTTEQRPSRHFHNAESLGVYEASLWLWFERNCRLPIAGCRLVVLTPSPAQVPHSSLVHMFDIVRQKSGTAESVFHGAVGADGAWTLDSESVASALSVACGEGKPLMILGTAFSFVHLVDWLGELDLQFKLPAGSRVMETGGYKGRSRTMPKAELHALITQRLGIPASEILCEYGMSELSSQAYSMQNFQFPPWARVQIVSPETGREVAEGETGLIRVFDLANVFSVLAVQTEDLGVRRGDGFELVGRAAQTEPRGCSLMAAGGIL